MALTVVQMTFKLNMPGKEYARAIAPLAHSVADVTGLRWKIWLLNESTHEAGGIYLFEDEDSANAFLRGQLVEQVKSAPIIADLHTTQFAVLDSLTAITRGPVMEYS
jgi:hypothetical protein